MVYVMISNVEGYGAYEVSSFPAFVTWRSSENVSAVVCRLRRSAHSHYDNLADKKAKMDVQRH